MISLRWMIGVGVEFERSTIYIGLMRAKLTLAPLVVMIYERGDPTASNG